MEKSSFSACFRKTGYKEKENMVMVNHGKKAAFQPLSVKLAIRRKKTWLWSDCKNKFCPFPLCKDSAGAPDSIKKIF